MRQVHFLLDREPTLVQPGDRFRWDPVAGTVAVVRAQTPLYLGGDNRFVVGPEAEARRLFRVIAACLNRNLHRVPDGTDAIVYEVATTTKIFPQMIAARFQLHRGPTELMSGDVLVHEASLTVSWLRSEGYDRGPLFLGEQLASEDPYRLKVGPSLPVLLSLHTALTGLPYKRIEGPASGETRYVLMPSET